MGHQQQDDIPGHTEGLPAFLSALDPILPREVQRIVEDEPGRFEADPMFAAVALALRFIPGKQQQL
jgi:hypothetical protein